MKLNIISAITLIMAFAAVGCSDEDIYTEYIGNDPTSSSLQFDVNAFTVTGSTSRASEPSEEPEPESAAEKKIRDFWLFQFKPDGSQLAAPVYYSIPDDGATLNDLTNKAYEALSKDEPMTIYVITNTGSKAWVKGDGFDTLEKVKEQTLPSPFPIQAGIDENNDDAADDNIYIPMSGQVDNVTAVEGGIIVVPVTRMYAKIKIKVGFNEPSMDFYYADVKGIPWYCKVTALSNGLAANGEPAAVPFPDGTRMISRAFNSKEVITDDKGNNWLILYMPENIRGEIDRADKSADKNIPENALTVSIRSKYKGEDYYYTVYPGENKVNNFNIRRNCVYRVGIDVRNITDQHNPSSNCFIVKPGEMLSFEPYNRVEKGGEYDIKDYLDPSVPKKAIAKVGIIWQTKNCIGDNSGGDLVKWTADTENPINSKLTITKTGIEGNALVGAYNSDGDIIWSWHIWVTPNEPDNIANAIIYTTYRWDSNHIYLNERIPGYGIMPCNLGALAFRSDDDMPSYPTNDTDMKVSGYSVKAGERFPESQIRTFGMLYQWGRKDPFPPMIYSTGTEDLNNARPGVYNNTDLTDYTDAITGLHFANDNTTEVGKTADYDTKDLFHSTVLLERSGIFNYTNKEEPIQYGINHPTVYISGCNPSSTTSYNRYGGDWCGPDTHNRLWGETEDYSNSLNVTDGHYIRDGYGEKSIFDPCPKGWRVPPGDLWMGFTKTGKNPSQYDTDFETVNYSVEESGHRPGMSMYVQAWGTGPTAYFPLQGTRNYNGKCSNPGLCGNYHNATTSGDYTVNILHLHRNMNVVSGWNGAGGATGNMLFRIFEFTATNTSRSTASPVRCVRDSR